VTYENSWHLDSSKINRRGCYAMYMIYEPENLVLNLRFTWLLSMNTCVGWTRSCWSFDRFLDNKLTYLSSDTILSKVMISIKCDIRKFLASWILFMQAVTRIKPMCQFIASAKCQNNWNAKGREFSYVTFYGYHNFRQYFPIYMFCTTHLYIWESTPIICWKVQNV
jgi:hypothetical protein